ncbi:MAG: Rpn family recombination-promoting nuclease/putative transposase [Polyangiaceae bacterium]|nr:Rpn family recombination-promoting nuclease/putative transposase [Polyangiaceae bacterium]
MGARAKRKRAKRSSKASPSPHNALFLRTFTVPENTASELRCILDRELVDVIDWSSLQLESSQFVGTDLLSDFSDVLYSVDVRGRKTLFHILFEHESGYKPWSLLQALRYQVDKWEEFAAQPIGRGDKRLPPILTIILHHGDGGWKSSCRFRDYFKLDDDLARMFAPYLVDYGVVVDDVSRVDAEALLQRPVTLAARLTLLCFRFVREPSRLLDELLKMKDELRVFFRGEEGNACLRGVFTYLELGAKVPEAELKMAAQFMLTGYPEIDEILNPGLTKKIFEAREKRLEAKVERAERKAQEAERKAQEAQREAERKAKQEVEKNLLLQLERRFGSLPDDAVAHVKAAASSEITEMAMRVLSAQSLDEVLRKADEQPSQDSNDTR